MPTPHRCVALALFLSLCGTVAAQEKERPENPEYTSWAKQKKGTVITLTTTLKGVDDKTDIGTDVFTHRLVEIKDDMVILETKAVQTRLGKVTTQKPYQTTVMKMFVPAEGAGKEGVALLKPAGTVKEDEAKIKIGKVEYKTMRYAAEQKDAFGDPVELTVWLSPDVPGCVVKKEYKLLGKRHYYGITELKWVPKP